jgi:hypothetical protein
MPWLLIGYKHAGTMRQLLKAIAERRRDHARTVIVHTHTVKAHNGVSAGELADWRAKFVCTDSEFPTNLEAMGKVHVPREYPLWSMVERGDHSA